MLSTGKAIHLTHRDPLGRVDGASRNAPAACGLGTLPCTSLDTLKIPPPGILCSHIKPGLRFQVSSCSQKGDLWSCYQLSTARGCGHVAGNNSPAGKATRRAAGQHLESPVPTQSPGQVGWTEHWKEKCPVGLRGTAPSTQGLQEQSLTSLDGCCPRLEPAAHISEVLNHSSSG